MKTSDPPVVVEQLFDCSRSIVWNAITVRDEMVQWFFDNIPEFKTAVGFKTQFHVKAPSRDFMHLWEVTEVIPEEKLVVKWQYEGLAGKSFVTMQLHEENDQTQFVVSTDVAEDFDDSIPEFQRESCVGGWHYFINERLFNYLAP